MNGYTISSFRKVRSTYPESRKNDRREATHVFESLRDKWNGYAIVNLRAILARKCGSSPARRVKVLKA